MVKKMVKTTAIITKKTIMMSDDIIDLLENLQCDIAREKYQTERKLDLWESIEKLIHKKDITFETELDQRFKTANMFLKRLGAVRRIDHVKASFIETLYLELNDDNSISVRLIDHCVCYSVTR